MVSLRFAIRARARLVFPAPDGAEIIKSLAVTRCLLLFCITHCKNLARILLKFQFYPSVKANDSQIVISNLKNQQSRYFYLWQRAPSCCKEFSTFPLQGIPKLMRIHRLNLSDGEKRLPGQILILCSRAR